jgi:flagellar protein FlaI
MIRTKIDDLIDLIKLGDLTVGEAAKRLDWSPDAVDRIVKLLEAHSVVDLYYPLNIAEDPVVTLKTELSERAAPKPPSDLTDSYPLKAEDGGVLTTVKIFFDNFSKRPVYHVDVPSVSPYSRIYFSYLQDEIAKEAPADTSGAFGSKKGTSQAEKRARVTEKIKAELSPQEKDLAVLSGLITRSMYGLGDIDILMQDPSTEEIIINKGEEPIGVYHRKYGWMHTNLFLGTDEDISNMASLISRRAGKQISTLVPLLDAQLDTGDRVNATLMPVSSSGNTLTIRKFSRDPWTIVNLSYGANKTLSPEMAALIWQAVHYEFNVLIGGGTASGKTSMLNAVFSLIQPHHRVVTIEDTRELMPAKYEWNWIPLISRSPNQEGKGEVTTLDLMINALRMRPDRMILGEIRRKAEAEVLFEAMHTGHSVLSTVHADTGTQLINRLTHPPIEIPQNELEAINLVVMQYRDRRRNIRRTLEISEVIPTDAMPDLNHVFLWRPRTDAYEFVKAPSRYYDYMNMHTGLIEREIVEDQQNKAAILDWMNEWKWGNADQVGAVMKAYYADESAVLDAVEKNVSPEKV